MLANYHKLNRHVCNSHETSFTWILNDFSQKFQVYINLCEIHMKIYMCIWNSCVNDISYKFNRQRFLCTILKSLYGILRKFYKVNGVCLYQLCLWYRNNCQIYWGYSMLWCLIWNCFHEWNRIFFLSRV